MKSTTARSGGAQADVEQDEGEMLLELPPLIAGKVIEMSSGGINVNGHA